MEMRLVKISMDVVFLQNFEIPQIDLFVQREFIFNIFSLKSRKKKIIQEERNIYIYIYIFALIMPIIV